MLFGDLLDHARNGVDGLFARDARFALQQALRNQHTVLAGDLALLVHVADLHSACTHHAVALQLLRGIRQNRIMASDAVYGLASIGAYLVHKRLLARKEHHGKPAHIVVVIKIGNEDIG